MSTALPVEQHLAAGLEVGAVDQPRQFGAARADQPGNAQHFALVQLEAAWLDPPAAVGDALDLEDHRSAAAVRVVLLLVEAGQVAADHHLDQRVGGELGALDGADIGAVAQHRDPVGQLVDLGHAVADVDRARCPRCAAGGSARTGARSRARTAPSSARRAPGSWTWHAGRGRSRPAAARRSTACRPVVSRPERRAQPLEHRAAAVLHRLAVDRCRECALSTPSRCSRPPSGSGPGSAPGR